MEYNPIIYYTGKLRDKANKLLVDELEKRGLIGIAPSHGSILLGLFFRKRLSMKEIAAFINKDKSTVTSLVNKLIKFGYVEKEQSADDSRSFFISLTQKGEDTKKDFEEISTSLNNRVTKSLGEDEINTLITLLKKINDSW